jgi:hypothetical protein
VTATVAEATLPNVDESPRCSVIDALDDWLTCRRPASWLLHSVCPACGFRERDFACARCWPNDLMPLACLKCPTELVILRADALPA